MTTQEKVLYHQIHPLKLFVDITTTAPSLYYFWKRNLVLALIWTFLPPIVVSLLLVRFANLERYKESAVGKYLAVSMTPAMQGVRLAGAGVMAVGAWYRITSLFPLGLVVVVFGWVRGLLFPHKTVFN